MRDGRPSRFTRLATALVAASAVIATGVAGSASGAGRPATGPVAKQVSHVVAAALSFSTGQAVTLLASNGIATVASEASSAPVQPVTAGVGLTFTEPQVATMAAQARGDGGTLGSSLDAVVPTGKGAPPFSYLLAAWVNTATSGGAAEIRAIMGTVNGADAPSLSFPSIALPLFTAATVHAIGSPFGKGPALVVPAFSVAAPCSLIAGFLQKVLSTVFDNLKLNSPTGTTVVAKVGSFFVNVWNAAVSYAQSAVAGLTAAALNLVVGKVAAAAAAAGTVAEVVSNIVPWTVSVTATPPSVALGDGGSFKGVVSSGGGVDYPPSVQDCAQKLNVPLPQLSAKGAKATWTVTGPLIPTSDTSVTLGGDSSNTLSYRTMPSCGAAGKGQATLTVSRPAVAKLGTLVNTWLSGLLSAAGPFLKPLLQPLISSMLAKLDSLTQVSGTGTVTLTASPGSGASSCPCMIGHWTVTNETLTLTGAGTLEGGKGATWTLTSEGMATIDHNGSTALSGTAVKISITYSGVETGRYTVPADSTATSGTWTLTPQSSTVESTTTVDGNSSHAPVPFDPAPQSGEWTCSGQQMTAGLKSSEYSQTVQLERTS